MSSSDIDLDFKVVTMEDSTEQFTRNISEDLEWIHISSIVLKKSDKESILDGRRLTDMHINVAQKILSEQFLSFSGFDSTLKQRCIGKWIDNYVHTNFVLPWLSLDYCKHSVLQGASYLVYLIHSIVKLTLLQRRLLQIYFPAVIFVLMFLMSQCN